MLLRWTSSLTLSFSNFSSCSRDLLLISSVNAASCIISKGVSLSFLRRSVHFYSASIPSILFQSGFAKEPRGALAYLALFFFSPSPSKAVSPSESSLRSNFFLLLSGLTIGLTSTFFSSLALLRLSISLALDLYYSSLLSPSNLSLLLCFFLSNVTFFFPSSSSS